MLVRSDKVALDGEYCPASKHKEAGLCTRSFIRDVARHLQCPGGDEIFIMFSHESVPQRFNTTDVGFMNHFLCVSHVEESWHYFGATTTSTTLPWPKEDSARLFSCEESICFQGTEAAHCQAVADKVGARYFSFNGSQCQVLKGWVTQPEVEGSAESWRACSTYVNVDTCPTPCEKRSNSCVMRAVCPESYPKAKRSDSQDSCCSKVDSLPCIPCRALACASHPSASGDFKACADLASEDDCKAQRLCKWEDGQCGDPDFVPLSSDVLVATVQKSKGYPTYSISLLEGINKIHHGMQSGYARSDLEAKDFGGLEEGPGKERAITFWDCGGLESTIYRRQGATLPDTLYLVKRSCSSRPGAWSLMQASDLDSKSKSGDLELFGNVTACVEADLPANAFSQGEATSAIWVGDTDVEATLNASVAAPSCGSPAANATEGESESSESSESESPFAFGTLEDPTLYSLGSCECFGQEHQHHAPVTSEAKAALQENAEFNNFVPEYQLLATGDLFCEISALIPGGQSNDATEDECISLCSGTQSCKYAVYAASLRMCMLFLKCDSMSRTGMSIKTKIFGFLEPTTTFCRIADEAACWSSQLRRQLLEEPAGDSGDGPKIRCAFADFISQCDIMEMTLGQSNGCSRCQYLSTDDPLADGRRKLPLPDSFPSSTQLSVSCRPHTRMMNHHSGQSLDKSIITCVSGTWINANSRTGLAGFSCMECVQVAQPQLARLRSLSLQEMYYLSRRPLQHHVGGVGCTVATEATASPLQSQAGCLCTNADTHICPCEQAPKIYFWNGLLRTKGLNSLCLRRKDFSDVGFGWCTHDYTYWSLEQDFRLRVEDTDDCLCQDDQEEQGFKTKIVPCELCESIWFFDGAACEFSMELLQPEPPMQFLFKGKGGIFFGISEKKLKKNVTKSVSKRSSVREPWRRWKSEAAERQVSREAASEDFGSCEVSLSVSLGMYGKYKNNQIPFSLYTAENQTLPERWTRASMIGNGKMSFFACVQGGALGTEAGKDILAEIAKLEAAMAEYAKKGSPAKIIGPWVEGDDEDYKVVRVLNDKDISWGKLNFKIGMKLSTPFNSNDCVSAFADLYGSCWVIVDSLFRSCGQIVGCVDNDDDLYMCQYDDDLPVRGEDLGYDEDHNPDFDGRYCHAAFNAIDPEIIEDFEAQIDALKEEFSKRKAACSSSFRMSLEDYESLQIETYDEENEPAEARVSCGLLSHGRPPETERLAFGMTSGQFAQLQMGSTYHAGAADHRQPPFDIDEETPVKAFAKGWLAPIENGAAFFGLNCPMGFFVKVDKTAESPYCSYAHSGSVKRVSTVLLPASAVCDMGFALKGWYNLLETPVKNSKEEEAVQGFRIICVELPGISRLCERRDARCEHDEIVTGLQYEKDQAMRYTCCKVPTLYGQKLGRGNLSDIAVWEGEYCPVRLDKTERPVYESQRLLVSSTERPAYYSTDLADKNNMILDKHEITCGAREALSRWKLQQVADRYFVAFTCIPADFQECSWNEQDTVPYNKLAGVCTDSHVLVGMAFEHVSDGTGSLRWKCCQVPDVASSFQRITNGKPDAEDFMPTLVYNDFDCFPAAMVGVKLNDTVKNSGRVFCAGLPADFAKQRQYKHEVHWEPMLASWTLSVQGSILGGLPSMATRPDQADQGPDSIGTAQSLPDVTKQVGVRALFQAKPA